MSERTDTARGDVPAYLTIPRVCELTALSRTSVYEAVARGDLKVQHFGRAVRVPVAAYRAWCEGRTA